jgi:hypothetical protein
MYFTWNLIHREFQDTIDFRISNTFNIFYTIQKDLPLLYSFLKTDWMYSANWKKMEWEYVIALYASIETSDNVICE